MMLREEKILLKVSLMMSLLGLLTLIIISNRVATTKATPIESVLNSELSAEVRIGGRVSHIKSTGTVFILTIEDQSGAIKVIAEKEGVEGYLKRGMMVEVEGSVKEYKKQREVEAKSIRIRG